MGGGREELEYHRKGAELEWDVYDHHTQKNLDRLGEGTTTVVSEDCNAICGFPSL